MEAMRLRVNWVSRIVIQSGGVYAALKLCSVSDPSYLKDFGFLCLKVRIVQIACQTVLTSSSTPMAAFDHIIHRIELRSASEPSTS